MKFADRLDELNACYKAVKWVNKRGLMTAWRDCDRADWMLWLAGRLNIDKKLLVLSACDCAETALKYIPKGENRPAIAIQTARNWCDGKATKQDCRDAAYDAADADAAPAAAAAFAACSASNADSAAAYAAAAYAYAASAAAAAFAACSASNADSAAAYAAYAAADARITSQKTCADLVRARIPFAIIKKAYDDE